MMGYPPTTDQLYQAAIHILRLRRDGFQLVPVDFAHSVPLAEATPNDYQWSKFGYGDAGQVWPVTEAEILVLLGVAKG